MNLYQLSFVYLRFHDILELKAMNEKTSRMINIIQIYAGVKIDLGILYL